MAKTRTYYRTKVCFEMHVFDGNKCLLHCVYYPSKFNVPRYHFENFGLYLSDLNYEICRFMSAVNKVIAYPNIEFESLEDSLSGYRPLFADL